MTKKYSIHYKLVKFLRSKQSLVFNLNATDVLILRCLADYMDMNEEGKCFAFQSTLAFECRYSARRLNTRIKNLCEKTLIRRIRKWKSYTYYLSNTLIESLDKLSNDKLKEGQSDIRSTDNTSSDQVTNCPTTIDIEKKNKRNRLITIEPPGFLQFWELYFKKTGRKPCLQKWISQGLESKNQEIINALTIQNETVFKGKELRFIPNPLTYLTQERWNDEITEVSNAEHQRTSKLNPKQASIESYLTHLERSSCS